MSYSRQIIIQTIIALIIFYVTRGQMNMRFPQYETITNITSILLTLYVLKVNLTQLYKIYR